MWGSRIPRKKQGWEPEQRREDGSLVNASVLPLSPALSPTRSCSQGDFKELRLPGPGGRQEVPLPMLLLRVQGGWSCRGKGKERKEGLGLEGAWPG